MSCRWAVSARHAVAGRLETCLRLGPHLLVEHLEAFLRDGRLLAVQPAAPVAPMAGPLERHAVRAPAPVEGHALAEPRPEAARAVVAAGSGGRAQPAEVAQPDASAGWPQVGAVQPDAVEEPGEAAGPHAAREAEAAGPHAVQEAAEAAEAAGQPGGVPEQAEAEEPDAARQLEAQPGLDAAPGLGLAVPSVAVWAAHPGRLRLAPGPQPMAWSAHVIQSSPIASPTMRSSQAAGDEVWSCDLGS
jgi:hypothetical protein